MRGWVTVCALLAYAFPLSARDRRPATPPPAQFEIGRHTFFDFGPPSDFYELFLVRPTATGSSIEKVTLTPPGGSCVQPATVETTAVSVKESVNELLGGENPCLIPEKELRREIRRCKKCLVFSGANIAMRFQCGDQGRIIRADILDKDMFDRAARTPTQTSWTMQLLRRLDQATGPTVMDRPVFAQGGQKSPPPETDSLRDVGEGKFDGLFQGAPDKPSDLYRAARHPPRLPEVRVALPVQAQKLVTPTYPPLARLARIQGIVAVRLKTNPEGGVSTFTIENGHPMLRGSVEEAVKGWRFSKEQANQEIEGKIEFEACPVQIQ